ncbi:MAG: hypothetical protein AB2404_02465 [Planifilum fimeticola]
MRKGLWLLVPFFFFLLVMLAVPALLVSYPSATPQERASRASEGAR